jgi:lipopolysaccharide transport system ATP-binding protein
MHSDVAISVKNLTKTYRIFNHPGDRIKQALTFGQKQYHKEFTALKDVSFEIKKGETVGIIGRNGSGKSTLLQLICGILKPTSGSVEVNGRISALLELGAGFNPEFTGRENVYFQGAVLGFTREQMDERFEHIVKFADIGAFIDQSVRTYSSGMYVRLAFAVAAHVDAELLVIDEALSVGDAFFVQKCMRYIDSFVQSGGTILFVSHDIAAVAQLCQTVYWIVDGEVKRQGDPKMVIEGYIESIYQTTNSAPVYAKTPRADMASQAPNDAELRDVRQDFINSSLYRNAIAVSQFPRVPSGFGDNGASITEVALRNADGDVVANVLGGELLTLQIRGRANKNIAKPLVGFFVKNSTGQTLFGDNTYLTYRATPPSIRTHQEFDAQFTFRCPILPLGDYAVTVAIAEGTQTNPVQHHWIHDALLLRSISSSVATGLVGIPMHRITLHAV